MAQPTTPKSTSKGSGIPIGGKKAPPKSVTPEPSKKPVEEATHEADEATQQLDESSSGNPDEPSTPQPEEVEEKVNEAKKEEPEKLDEAIDLGDEPIGDEHEEHEEEEEQGDGEKTEMTEAPSELDHLEPEPEHEVEGTEVEGTEVPDEEVGEQVEEAAEEPKEAVEETAEQAEEATEEPKEALDETAEQAEEAAEEPKEALEETAEEAQDKTSDLASSAGETTSSLTGAVGDKASEAGDFVEDKAGEAGEAVEGESGEAVKNAEGEVEEKAEDATEEAGKALDFTILEGKKVNKGGFVVDDKGDAVGKLIEGDPKKLAGKKCDDKGQIWNDSGKVIGRCEPIPNDEREPTSSAPFEDFPDAVVDPSGKILFEGKKVGIVTEGDIKKLAGKKVDEDGDILDKNGNVIGKAIREDEEEPEPEPEPEVEKIDCSALNGLKVNKAGNVVGDNGKLVGRVIQGALKALVGKTVDKEGNIHNDTGKIIGRAEPIPDDEKEDDVETPFEDFPGAVVEKSGNVVWEGKVIGKLTEGDPKKLAGKAVDPEGDVVDRHGTVLGKCERWEEEEVPEEKVDMSILAGKRVNKLGNVVDSSGTIFGKLIEGDVKALAGKMCDKQGFVRNEGGDVVGRAELVPEGDREGVKTGPFADFPDATVTKDGKVTSEQHGIVGRVTEGDVKKLFGKAVDEDGDVLDKNGNVLGKCERWEEEAVEEAQKDVHPLAGLKVNKKGEVYDNNGELVGKLTEGLASRCAGQKIDEDGDVVDQKGNGIGHVSLIGDIEPEVEPEPEPEPEESEEDKQKRLQAEEDKKLAQKMSTCIQQSLEQIQPIMKMITELIEKAERVPKDELDEQKVVDEVKPLIEEGGRILQEANGVIRGLDPDGRIAANAKHKTAAREASPEEYRLADLLKELTGTVTTTIDKAKKKIADMPHVKKELNPLWGLLSEPLFQILAAVGLLLSGVLGLVGQLLNGLGLGGLVHGLLGGLGVTRVLDNLGLGKILAPITGSKKK